MDLLLKNYLNSYAFCVVGNSELPIGDIWPY